MIIRFFKNTEETTIRNIQRSLDPELRESHITEWRNQPILVTSASIKADQLQDQQPVFKDIIESQTDYQLCTRKFEQEDTIVKTPHAEFGGRRLNMIAGPCAVENEYQVMKTAETLVKDFNIKLFRAGCFKPRTSPYSFQGLEYDGLRLLEKVRNAFGVGIVTEVKDASHAHAVCEVADIVQVGTKAMYNFELLRLCARSGKPVILKRGFMSTIKEFLQAADVILSEGNSNVILCERGIRGFDSATRFVLDFGSAAAIKRISHLPLLMDPSHGVGKSDLVGDLAAASAAMRCSGLLVEVHHDPSQALSDKPQALSFDQFRELHSRVHAVCKATEQDYV